MNVRLLDYAILMRWDKPIGALLLLWPTLWALWLAGAGQPQQAVVLIFLLGVWVTRSAGCVVNDLADRKFDPHVERTRNRPLAAGRVSVAEALLLAIALGVLALLLALSLNNRLSLLLACAGALIAITYPFMKRFHHLPQAHLGFAFGWGIPMAYAALGNQLPPECWLLFATNAAWVLVYDTQYAMSDRVDDLKIGVKSSAILFARFDRLAVGILQLLTVLGMVVVGLVNQMSWVYFLGLAAGGCFFLYQQVLIQKRERLACFRAFLNNNGFGLCVFCAIVIDFLPTSV